MEHFFKYLLETHSHWGGFIARLTIGLIMFPHGMQKTLGWYGGDGFKGTLKRFHKEMRYPWIIAFLIIFFESFGSIFLIIGFASRLMAFGIMIVMIGAIIVVHRHYGYFLNWHNTQEGEGMQFNLLMIGLCLISIIIGSGSFSIDALIIK